MQRISRYVLAALWLLLVSVAPAFAIGDSTPATRAQVIQMFKNSSVVTSDTAALSGAGFLQCIMISQNDAAPTAGSIIIYDNTAESGTQIFNWTLTTSVFVPFQICPQRVITTGIYIGFTTTADVNVSVSYLAQ